MSSNPYETFEEANTGSVEFRFEGTIGRADLSRAAGSRIVLVGFLGATVYNLYRVVEAAQWAWALRDVLTAAQVAQELFVPTAMLIGAAYVAWRVWEAGARVARMAPFALGHVRGRLSTECFELETERVSLRIPAKSIVIRTIEKTHITVLGAHPWIIPASLFENYEGANRLAKEIKRLSKPILAGDERLLVPLDEAERIPAPDGAITFDGPIYSSDLTVQSFRHQISRARRSLLRIVTVTLAAGGFLAYATEPAFGAFFVLVFAIYFYFRSIRPTRRIIKALTQPGHLPDKVALHPCGWVSEVGVATMSRAGRSHYTWDAFHRVDTKGDTVALSTPGQPSIHIFLNRRQFNSDSDWSRVISLTAANVTPNSIPASGPAGPSSHV